MCAFSIPRLSLSLPLSSPLPSISIYDCFLFVSYFLFHIHILHPCVSLSNYFDGFFIFHFSIQIIFFTALSISFVAHLPVHFHSLPLFRLPQRVCVYIFVLIKLKHIIWAQYQHYISPLLPLKCITTCFGYALKGYNALWMSSERAQCPIILRHAANEMILKLKIRWKKKKKRRYIIHTHTHRRNRKCTRFQCTAPGSQCSWCSTKYVAKSQHTENTIIKCYIRWWNKTRKEYNSGNVACSGVIIDPFWMYMMWKQSSLPHRASAWHEAYG